MEDYEFGTPALTRRQRKIATKSDRTRAQWNVLRQWFDADVSADGDREPDQTDWLRALPFLGMHAGCPLW